MGREWQWLTVLERKFKITFYGLRLMLKRQLRSGRGTMKIERRREKGRKNSETDSRGEKDEILVETRRNERSKK